MTDKFDVYSFIRNKETREYMRKYKEFSPLDMARLIIFSFKTIDEKIDALRLLAEDIVTEDKVLVLTVANLLEEALAYIYNSYDNKIINISRANAYWHGKCRNPYDGSLTISERGLFRTFQDYVSEYEITEAYKASLATSDNVCHEDLDYIVGEVYNIKNVVGEMAEELSFEAAYFDNHIKIYHLTVSDEWAERNGYPIEVSELLNASRMDRYSLPYKYGESVMLKTPFMVEPMYGGLYSSMDGNGSWYHFFYYADGRRSEMIDLSYHEIEPCTHLNVFDWLCRSDKMLSFVVNKELFGKDYKCFSKYTRLADIKEEGYSFVYCNVKVLEKNVRLIKVTLLDDSGTIDGEMCVYENDTKWIEELEETGEKVFICGHFVENLHTGKMYMDFHSDVERLPETFMKNYVLLNS